MKNVDSDFVLRDRLYAVLHGKTCKIRHPSCFMGKKCIEGALQVEHLKKCRNEQCEDVTCYENRTLLTHWINCTREQSHCHVCPVLSNPKQSYDISDLLLCSTASTVFKAEEWKSSISYKWRKHYISKLIFDSLNLADGPLDKFTASLIECELFHVASSKNYYRKKIAGEDKQLQIANHHTINIKKFKPVRPIMTVPSFNSKADCSVPLVYELGNTKYISDFMVRSIPNEPRHVYMQKIGSISPFRHKVVLLQVVFQLDGKIVFHKVLERLDTGYVNLDSKNMINSIIDEVSQKIYVCLCLQKLQDNSLNPKVCIKKIEIKEYDFKFGPRIDTGQRKIVSVTERKKAHISVDLGMDPVITAQLLISPFDGSFVLDVVRKQSQDVMELTFGYLHRKKKADRVLFFTPTKSIIASVNTGWCYIMDSRSELCHVLYFVNKYKLLYGKNDENGDITFRIDQEPSISLNHVNNSKCQNIANVYSLLPVEARKTLFRKHDDDSVDFHAFLHDNFTPLGFVYKLFIFQIAHVLVGMKRTRGSLTLLGNFEDVQLLITLPSDPKLELVVFLSGSNMILNNNNASSGEPRFMKISLSNPKYSRKMKGYRTCAMCNKMETKKRRNEKGERIADFKVCRQCKKRKLDHSSPRISSHYCSIECLQSHWPTHKQQHTRVTQE